MPPDTRDTLTRGSAGMSLPSGLPITAIASYEPDSGRLTISILSEYGLPPILEVLVTTGLRPTLSIPPREDTSLYLTPSPSIADYSSRLSSEITKFSLPRTRPTRTGFEDYPRTPWSAPGSKGTGL